MQLILIILFLIITILSIIVFNLKGLLSLLITIPLIIMYLKSDSITRLLQKEKRRKDKDNLSERKEVEVVSSRDRKKKPTKKKIVKETKTKTNNERNRNTKSNKKIKKSLLRKLLTIALICAIACVFLVAAFFIYIVVSTEKFDPEALKNQDQTVIYDKDGEVITTLGAQKRETVTYDDLPQVLVDALIATEDSRFYQHNGVDTARFLKASILQVLGKSDAGGASTLTMQVVKNNLTNTESSGIKGIIRKFKDVYISVFFVERKYTKEDIIALYVNDSCLGGTIYGVEEASKYYFGKSVSDLSLPEASLLAGMYQAPNRYDPYKNPENAYKRRKTVLSLMVRHGYITKEEEKMANAVSIESMLSGAQKASDYQGYIDTVIEEVKEKTGDDPTLVSMKIYTALNREIQDGINKVLNGEAHNWENEEVQAGIAVTNVNDGTIVAIGAGRNRTAGDWNYATQSYRQPGSTAKPIFDYAPGIEYNDFSTYTLFNDEPWQYTNGPAVGNWDGNYSGLITLRQALSVSRNVPALKAFQQVDKKNIAEFVNGLGLDIAYSTKSDNYKKYDNGGDNLLNEAYSIGGMSRGVTPLDMAEAYASFANGGYHIETHAVTKIEYRSSGKVVDFTEEKEKVMSDATAYLMNNLLQYAAEYGFSGGSRIYGTAVAAKTGTSNLDSNTIKRYGLPGGAVNDLWTVAYTPEYAVALWYGYAKVDSTHYLGGASAPKDAVMASVVKYIPSTTKKWEMPSSVVAVTVEKDTWPVKLPSEYTPDGMKITEYFKKGTQPTEISDRYAKLPAVTNIKNTKSNDGYKITWNWKAPDSLDSASLNKYFSNSVYGNQGATYLKNRLDYNENTLGGAGFRIYVKNQNGGLTEVGFTKNTEYTYVPNRSGNIEIVVKAEYQSFKSNASDGASTIINSSGSMIPSNDLEVKLNGSSNVTVDSGNYNENGITASMNGKTVTNDVTVKYQVNNNKYLTVNELEFAINKLSEGEYEITYIVTYKNEETKITRKIKIN